MSEAAELVVTLRGADVGLSALLRKIEADLNRTDRTSKSTEDSALRLAQAQARLAAASGNAAGAVSILETAIARTDRASLSSISAQTQLVRTQQQLARSSGDAASANAALPRTFAGLTSEVQGTISGMLGFGAALTTVTAVANSFKDAFNFKAQLDATTASISAQLAGVRDVSQVYAQAAQFARTYKLTQEETTQAIAASIGVMRASKAPVEDILGVLARMQVLSPEQSLQEAAIALKALASGDTTSLVTRFEVGRDVANQMKAEIQGGADAVQVMSKFLGDTGIGMDVLKTKTEGAAGALKDLAIAQEEMKLAQAEWAAGPGLAILEAQTKATIGLTRVLSGSGGLREAFAGLAQEWGLSAGQASALFGIFVASEGQAAALASSTQAAATATQQQAAATQQATVALGTNAGVLSATTGALDANVAALDADSQAALLTAANSKILEQAKANLQAQAQAAAAGVLASGGSIEAAAARLAASSSLVDQLTAAYLRLAVASGEADAAQRKAAGAARLQSQAAQTRDLTGGKGIVSGGPGRDNSLDLQMATVLATGKQIEQEEKRLEAERKKIKGAGGAARISQEQKTSQQLIQEAQQYQERVAQIEADGLRKRQQAENSLRKAQLSGRAGFYAGLANLDDGALRADLSARYEQAAQEAGRIAQTQGADAAQQYLEASRQQIEGESSILQAIKDAQDAGDAGKAEYLKGVLALQQAANAEELRQITEQGSAIAAEQAAAYAAAEAQYAAHLDRMNGIAAAKGFVPGTAALTAGQTSAPSPTTGTGGGPAPTGRAQPVEDVATPPAIDAQTSRLEGKLSEVVDAVGRVEARVGAVEGAVRGLKQSRAAG